MKVFITNIAALVVLVLTAEAATATELPRNLNPSWVDHEVSNGRSANLSNALLSDSGYPVIFAVQEWALCVSPFLLREANDAMKAGRKEWASKIPGCVVLPRGTRGEWTKERVIDDVLEFRFEVKGSPRPITLYGPAPAMSGVNWFGLPRKEAETCQSRSYGDWFHDCVNIFDVLSDVRIAPDASPAKLIMADDGKILRVIALITFEEYQHFFTDTPQVVTTFEGSRYVADEQFFNKRFPPVLTLKNERIPLEWDGSPHWRVPAQFVDHVTSALKAGADSIALEYAHLSLGGGQKATVSTKGFVEALAAMSDKPKR